MDEFELIKVLFKAPALDREDVVLGIGDDAACVRVPVGQDLYISTDTLVADVHFLKSWDPFDIAWKAVMVNVSDMAAMAAYPCWLSLALTLENYDEAWLQRFSQGLHTALKQFGIALIGGDTTRGPLSLSLTIHGLAPQGKAIRRKGAKPTDEIWVTGTLGAAALAVQLEQVEKAPKYANKINHKDRALLLEKLRHPQARVDFNTILQTYASAAIDISDGFSADLMHICEASGVGACLSLEAIPVHPVLMNCLKEEALTFAMQGGDDYELCFTSPARYHDDLQQVLAAAGLLCYRVGVIEALPGLRAFTAQGEFKTVTPAGYRHF